MLWEKVDKCDKFWGKSWNLEYKLEAFCKIWIDICHECHFLESNVKTLVWTCRVPETATISVLFSHKSFWRVSQNTVILTSNLQSIDAN